MKVKRESNRNHVRVEELLPCKRFLCNHESMSCAIQIWCPDGCYDSNDYGGACIPKCIDCVFYPDRCTDWEKFPDKHEHSVLSRSV